jgi:hypothetical protein
MHIFSTYRQGSVISDVTILYDALDGQQLVVLYEDLDQDGLLNQEMPVVYNPLVVSEGMVKHLWLLCQWLSCSRIMS